MREQNESAHPNENYDRAHRPEYQLCRGIFGFIFVEERNFVVEVG